MRGRSGVEDDHRLEDRRSADRLVLPGQLVLDPVLTRKQPVHGRIRVIFVRRSEPQALAESGATGLLAETASGGKLRARIQDPCHDQRHGEIPVPARAGRRHFLESNRPQRSQHRCHMAVWSRSHNLPVLRCRDIALTAERSPDHLDDVPRQVGDVPQGLVTDLPVPTEGPATEMALVDPSLVSPPDCGYVDGSDSPWHVSIVPLPERLVINKSQYSWLHSVTHEILYPHCDRGDEPLLVKSTPALQGELRTRGL